MLLGGLSVNLNHLKTQYLVQGFKYGFSLKYQGPLLGNIRTAPNLKLNVGTKFDVWNKVMTEVKAGRYAGPYKDKPPFDTFVQSPIGLVPKDKGKKTRLIFHLSYPREGDSVNSSIPREFTTVKYPDFFEAVNLCFKAGRGAFCAKSDMSMAFRNVPLSPESWPLMVLKAHHPITDEVYWFVDKCLPFGASISCKIFQDISDSIAHLVKCRTRKPLVNYLDDYFFSAIRKVVCDTQVRKFLAICEKINFPVSLEKTFWSTTLLVFLGLLIDTVNQIICIPIDKLEKALDWIDYFLNKKNKKVTVLQVQKMCGTLNFISRCIIPGRAFTRRLYAMAGENLKSYHHVRVTAENRLDLQVWRKFLTDHIAFSRPFMDLCISSAEDLDMYSDAAKSWKRGVGAHCKKEWVAAKWSKKFINECDPSIEFLELYGVVIAVLLWIKDYPNRRVCLFTDNQSVKNMVNNNS